VKHERQDDNGAHGEGKAGREDSKTEHCATAHALLVVAICMYTPKCVPRSKLLDGRVPAISFRLSLSVLWGAGAVGFTLGRSALGLRLRPSDAKIEHQIQQISADAHDASGDHAAQNELDVKDGHEQPHQRSEGERRECRDRQEVDEAGPVRLVFVPSNTSRRERM